MVAINFKKEFAEAVETGRKTQTIRKERVRRNDMGFVRNGGGDFMNLDCPWSPGGDLQLYTGMRTKSCRKLADARCVSVDHIMIYVAPRGGFEFLLNRGEERLSLDAQLSLAVADGFCTRDEFVKFFKAAYDLPFAGWLIKWELI